MRIANGRERRAAGSTAPRHRHDQAYAAIVLRGGYEESGNRGRFRVGPGDVLFHNAFDAHLDRFNARGADILNIELHSLPAFMSGRVRDADEIAHLAMSDIEAARQRLFGGLIETQPLAQDWQDKLANDLLAQPELRLDAWALRHGLAAETLSRGFGRLYGVTPAEFRAEARAHCALDGILRSCAPLADIAARTGHADQAHMSRAVKALTGASPRHWRASNPFKTAADEIG